MNKNQVLETIHQKNETKADFRYFFLSKIGNNEKDISKFNHYKNDGKKIEIVLDQIYFEKHLENLKKCSECEIMIKNDGKNKTSTSWLICEFVKVVDGFIYLKVKN